MFIKLEIKERVETFYKNMEERKDGCDMLDGTCNVYFFLNIYIYIYIYAYLVVRSRLRRGDSYIYIYMLIL